MKKIFKGICYFQILCGAAIGLGTITVTFLYAPQLKTVSTTLGDGAYDVVEQLDITISTFQNLKEILDGFEESGKAYKTTIANTQQTSEDFSKITLQWSEQATGFATVSTQVSEALDSTQKQLPWKIPTIDYETKEVKFNVPDAVKREDKTFVIRYPSSVKPKVEQTGFNYPSGASVRNCDKKILGNKIGYPCGIDISRSPFRFNTISDIETGFSEEKVKVPVIDVPVKQISAKYPSDFKFKYIEWFAKEKVAFKSSSEQLIKTSQTLSNSSDTLKNLSQRLSKEGDIISSLKETDKKISEVISLTNNLTDNKIPVFLEKLENQKSTVDKTKNILYNLNLIIIPILVIGILISILMILNGLVLLQAINDKTI